MKISKNRTGIFNYLSNLALSFLLNLIRGNDSDNFHWSTLISLVNCLEIIT